MLDAIYRNIRALADEFGQFRDMLNRFGLEYFRRYYGPYRAIVDDNADPAGLGRVTVNCPRARMPSGNGHWLFPMSSGAGAGHGEFFPPEKGDAVWIFFDNGDPSVPQCYLGGWYHGSDIPEDLSPDGGKPPVKRGWATPGGHEIVLDDTGGSEKILIKHKNGKIVQITSDSLSIGSQNGNFEPILLGKQVKQWLDAHVHQSAWGPTTAPTQPLPDAALSKDTETT